VQTIASTRLAVPHCGHGRVAMSARTLYSPSRISRSLPVVTQSMTSLVRQIGNGWLRKSDWKIVM
jgi:hypothetical protein